MDEKKYLPKIVLGVAAHPDDLDFGAAGTFARWAASGSEIYYLILTNGCKGTPDRNISCKELTKIRQGEQRKAASILGIKDVYFLDYEDGELEVSMELKKDIVQIIRQTKPDVVVTMDPTFVYSAERGFINHPDHRAAGQATLDAVFPLARDHLDFAEFLEAGLEPHITPCVLLVNFNHSNFAVDIASTIDVKMQALAAHKSQMADITSTQKMMRDNAIEVGEKHGYKYAEEFVRVDVQ